MAACTPESVGVVGGGGRYGRARLSQLRVEPSLRLAVYIYLVQAVILLAGGLACLFAGEYPFAVWGILLFVSDSLVGIRAFPNPERRIGWLSTYRILLAILVIYYTAQFAIVWWAI